MLFQHRSRSLFNFIRVLGLCAAAYYGEGGAVGAQQQIGTRPQLPAAISILDSNREQDGLLGPVRRIRIETAKLSPQAADGAAVEGPRALLETTTYAPQGHRLENKSYPTAAAGGNAPAAVAGREEYQYDDKGNVVEMTLRDEAGLILSKEVYAYQFDAFGNWTKMTASLVVFEGEQISYEPTEVTYRTISYYFDEATAKLARTTAATTTTLPAATSDDPSAKPTENSSPAGVMAGGGSSPTAAAEHHSTKPPIESPPSTKLPIDSPPATPEVANTAREAIVPQPSPTPAATHPSDSMTAQPPVAAASPPPQATTVISGGVISNKVISLPKPFYPDSARVAGVAGTVTVAVVIDTAGRVVEVESVRGPLLLRLAALEAARRARFSPALLAGQPIRSSGTIKYTFVKPE